MNNSVFSKTGAVFYILWGMLHIIGAILLFVALQESVDKGLSVLASNLVNIPSVNGNTAVAGLYGYYTYLLLAIAVFVTVIAVIYNWKNNPIGYWINLLFVGAVEIGIVSFLLFPGYMKWEEGGIGLSLFVLAAIASSITYIKRVRPTL